MRVILINLCVLNLQLNSNFRGIDIKKTNAIQKVSQLHYDLTLSVHLVMHSFT